MHIEREEESKALNIITKEIKNVRQKVKLLHQYWAQLVARDQETVINLLLEITDFIVQKAHDPSYSNPKYQHFVMRRDDEMKLDTILKVFVNETNLQLIYLNNIIKTHGDKLNKVSKYVHVYHKHIEVQLVDYTQKKSTKSQAGVSKLKDEINKFIREYDEKIDPVYVLFLFRFYEYEGLK